MGLSNDLLTQFAKVTNISKRTDTETTVYGTIVEYDGKNYVRLDGSDRLTPMTVTAQAEPGERVSIKIKNHTATVTGNISSPAARVGTVEEIEGKTKVYIDELVAGFVSTEYLEANYASIVKVDAIEANIDTLVANDVTINEKLTANEADIEKLKADTANIENLNAGYAKIGVLESNYADINTLIFGSATGDTIQTSFANAVIAQLGDAQIKSAMIENISADKILAGEIITNDVTVKSEDGRLIISDETIQISDENRVRVQIGKDASDDYSINIWDADGNLMFSQGGITDKAIKDAIIRNDMVSETANISASKLDIDSLFTEINGSDKTINSTKIYLDDEKQILSVAFKELTTDVEGLSDDVTSQGTKLDVIQGQIDSKIWLQDFDASSGGIVTQYSELKQTVDGISATVNEHAALIDGKADEADVAAVETHVANLELTQNSFQTTVSETYATKDSVKTLEVSGRNLIVRRDEMLDTYVLADGTVIDSEVNYKSATMADTIPVTAGETYTFSKDESAANYYFRWAWYDKDMNVLGRTADNASVFSWTAPADAVYIRVSYPYSDGAKPKLEKGSEVTDYCPSLEDVGIDLVNDYATIVDMEAAIKVESDIITSTVSKTYTTKEEFNDLEIGGCNLIKNSDFSDGARLWVPVGVTTTIELDDDYGTCLRITSTDIGSSTQRIYPSTTENFIHKSDADGNPGRYSLSFYAKTDSEATLQTNIAGGTAGVKNYTLSTEWQRFTHTYDASAGSITFWLNDANTTAYITRVQMERGDKVTDWKPASDEITVTSDLESATRELNSALDDVSERIVTAESRIEQIANAIAMLVVDKDGESLMIQDGDSWYFNTADIQGVLDDTAANLDELLVEFGSLDAVVKELRNKVDELGGLAEYVRIGTYEYIDENGITQTEPSIELGESDSEFKQRVTNTKSIFLDGAITKTSVSKDGVLTENIEVTNELKSSGLVEVTDDGDDTYVSKINYIWKVRGNGNYGLIYDGWLG